MQYYGIFSSDEKFYTAKEMAGLVSEKYKIVNYKGQPHVDFIRAVLEKQVVELGGIRMLRDGIPRVVVYENGNALLDFMDKVFLELLKEKALTISVAGPEYPYQRRNWQVYLKGVKLPLKKGLLPKKSYREYFQGNLINPKNVARYDIKSNDIA